MSKFRIFLISLVFSCLLLIGVGFAEEGDLWQTIGNVTVRKEPTNASDAISYFKQGIVVEEITQQDRWVKVRSTKSQIEGWVHKSMLMPVTKELQSGCEGVQGFSAVCPIKKDVKVPQGQSIEQPTKKEALPQASVQPDGQATSSGMVSMPALPKKLSGISDTQVSITGQQSQSGHATAPQVAQILSESTSQDMINTMEPGVLAGNAYIVEPEKTTIVKMSSSDVNRIFCPVDIKDVVYSEEKGIQVKISGKNAFVKFLVKRIGGKETYSKIPADLYVVCADKVYSIIAMPDRIPSVNVYLEDKEQKIKEVLEKNQAMPYEKKIVNYVKDFMSGKTPPEAVFSRVFKEYNLYQDIDIRELGQYIFEGEGFTVRVLNVTSKKQGVEIKEKDFLRKEITQNPLAISLDRLKLNQGEKAILLIIERTRG